MADYAGTNKLCATCVYWVAQRDVDILGSRVTNCAAQGRCAIPQGSLRNFQRPANACACFDYAKWPVLR